MFQSTSSTLPADHETHFMRNAAITYLKHLKIAQPTDYQIIEMQDLLFKVWLRRTLVIDDRLTPREKQCLQAISLGESIQSTAKKLDISERTVKAFRQAILEKFSCDTMEQAVAFGIRYGEIT